MAATGRTRPQKARTAAPDEDGAPKVIRLKSGAREPAPRVPLFSIDDTEYTIAAETRPNIALKYLNTLRKQGTEAAIAYMMEQLVGEEGWEALQNYEELTEDDLGQIVAAGVKVMNGALESPKGK